MSVAFLAMLQAEGIIPCTQIPDVRQQRKRPRTESPLIESDGGHPSKRLKPEHSDIMYETIDDIWQASMLLKPAFLNDQDLNVGLMHEELETLKVRRFPYKSLPGTHHCLRLSAKSSLSN